MISLAVCLLALSVRIASEETEECDAWSRVEQDIKHNYNLVSCSRNKLCSGMNCSGTINGNEFHAGIQVHPCIVPEGFDLFLNVPKLGINQWEQTFSHGDIVDFSGGIKGEIGVEKVKNGFSIGLKLKISVPGSNYLHELKTPLDVPIIQEVTIPVPACNQQSSITNEKDKPDLNSKTRNIIPLANVSKINSNVSNREVEGNCTISNYTCPLCEMCQQLEVSLPNGVCISIPEYRINEYGECIHDPNNPTYSGVIQQNGSAVVKPFGQSLSNSLLMTAIFVPIFCIICAVIITYAVVRRRVCHYIRRRIRVQVYEQVLLSQDEENDEQLVDPVV